MVAHYNATGLPIKKNLLECFEFCTRPTAQPAEEVCATHIPHFSHRFKMKLSRSHKFAWNALKAVLYDSQEVNKELF